MVSRRTGHRGTWVRPAHSEPLRCGHVTRPPRQLQGVGTGWAGGRTGLLRGAGWAGGAWAHHKLDDVLMPQTAASGESSQFCPASRWSDLLVKRGGRWRFLSGSSWALDIPQQHRSRTDTLSGSERALCYTKRNRTISIGLFQIKHTNIFDKKVVARIKSNQNMLDT